MENSGIIKSLIETFVMELEELKTFYANQRRFRIYASSILLIYDVNAVRMAVERSQEVKREWVKVRMIDFAHVFPVHENEEMDHNFVTGISNLIQIFKEVLD